MLFLPNLTNTLAYNENSYITDKKDYNIGPWCKCYKTQFKSSFSKRECLSSASHSTSSFVGKASSLPQSREREKCFTQVDSGLTQKHWTRLERLVRDKRYSLIRNLSNSSLSLITHIKGCSTKVGSGLTRYCENMAGKA
jgi:hypothetical protein